MAVCLYCGKELRLGNTKFCNKECQFNYTHVEKMCASCKKFFVTQKSKAAQECCSRRCAVRLRALHRRHSKLRHKGIGTRPDLGIFVRSKWEANFARILNWAGVEWQYEPRYFLFEQILRGNRTYTPDFYLPEYDLYIEIKGFMDRTSATKLRRMAHYYPDIKINVIGLREYRNLEEQYAWAIPEWEWGSTTQAKKAEMMRSLASVRPLPPKVHKIGRSHLSVLKELERNKHENSR